MKTKVFLVLALSATLGPSSAQNQRMVDSLMAVLATRVAGDRYAPSYELAFQLLDIDNERALDMISEAEKAALLSGDSLWIVKSKRVKGQILAKLERPGEAISLFNMALPIARRNDFNTEVKFICNTFGLAYWSRGRIDKALENFTLVLDLSQREKDTLYLALSLNNMGVIYYRLHDAGKALTYLLRAWDIKQKVRRPLYITPAINISLCYSFLHDYSRAAVYLKKSRESSRDSSDYLKMHQAFASGRIAYGLKEYDLALKAFRKSLALAKRTQDTRLMLDNVTVISLILTEQNRLSEAESYLKDAEQLAQQQPPFPQSSIELYSQFCQIYGKMRDYRKLALYQQKYIQLKDSVFSYELTNRLMTAEADFKERENNAKIAAQKEVLQLKENVIERQRALNGVTALLALMTLGFALLAFRGFKRKKNLNILLDLKIRERTMQLESSRDELLKNLGEMNLRFERASGFVNDSVNRIEGLCSVAICEVHDRNICSYLTTINATAKAIGVGIDDAFNGSVSVISPETIAI